MNSEMNKNVIWYREPYVWLVIGFPLSAVLAGIVTIILAINSDDGLVVDDYYKRGLEVNQVLERDRIALQYQLQARLDISSEYPEFKVVLNGNRDFVLPDEIKVNFLHPTRKGMDRHLLLKKDQNNIYHGNTPRLAEGKWYVLIESEDWRLFLDYSAI